MTSKPIRLRDDEQELDQLPPLEPDDDGTDGDFGDLLPTLADDPGTDDEEASDLDIGISLADLDDDGDNDDAHDLDIGLSVGDRSEPESSGDDDAEGPADYDPSTTVESLGEIGLGDDAQGTEEPMDDLVTENLPALDADHEGEAGDDLEGFSVAMGLDEEPPEWAPKPWSPPLVISRAPVTQFVDLGDSLLAIGREMQRVDRGSASVSTCLEEIRAVSSGVARDGRVLLATAMGELFDADPDGELRGKLGSWRPALGPRFAPDERLELARSGRVVLARSIGGRVIRSTDDGESWAVVDTGCVAEAIAGSEAGLAIWGRGPTGSVLATSQEGIDWVTRPASGPLGPNSTPMLAVTSAFVATAHPLSGLDLWKPGVAKPTHIARTTTVSAMAAGLDGSVVYLALHSDTTDRSDIAKVEPDSGAVVRIATMELDAHTDALGNLVDRSRIECIDMDASGDLWVGGELGIALWRVGGTGT